MTLRKKLSCSLPHLLVLGVLMAPASAAAQSDLDITMRMVADEEALDSSFVQEMELPESVTELEYDEQLEALDANELSSEAQALTEDLSLQARETRDALDTELPGETGFEPPAAELPLPDLGNPELPGGGELPGVDLPGGDVDLLEQGSSTLDSVTGQ